LQSLVVGGLAWQSVLTLVTQVTRTVSSLVLVHLLTPRDYGLAGMALMFTVLFDYFSELGLSSALVQRQSLSEADRSTVFWSNVAMGILLTAVGISISGTIAQFFHQPQLRAMFMVLATTFFITSLGITQAALIHRAMDFRAFSIRMMLGTACGAATAIAVAASGGGAWALIAQQVAFASVSTVLLWLLSDWRPRMIYSRTSLRKLGGLGANVLGANILDFIHRNTDTLLIGRFLGSASLGIYNVSYTVILFPIGRLMLPVQETLFPALSRLQADRARIGQLWLRAVRGITALILPAMLGLIVVAPDFVDVVLGRRWHAATPIVRILALVTIAFTLSGVATRVLLALDRSRLTLYLSVVNTVLAVVAFSVGLRWGLVGVASCYAAVAIPVQIAFVLFTSRAVGLSVRAFVRNIAGLAEASCLMAIACWTCRESLIAAGVPAALRLVVVVGVGVGVYVPAVAWRSRATLEEVRRFRSARRARNASLGREVAVRVDVGLDEL
jgi:O-antigen/teichoic acid export membrane protein